MSRRMKTTRPCPGADVPVISSGAACEIITLCEGTPVSISVRHAIKFFFADAVDLSVILASVSTAISIDHLLISLAARSCLKLLKYPPVFEVKILM